MMWLPAAFASAFIFGIGSFLFKVSSHRKYHDASLLLGLYLSGSVIFLIALLSKGDLMVSSLALAFSLLLGLGSYYGNTFLMKAYDTGPACLTSPLMSMNIVLVILMSVMLYHETMTQGQYAGIACMLTAVALLSCNFKNTLIKSRLWAVYVFLAILFIFMREGGLKIAHENGQDNLLLLFFGYLLAASFSSINLAKEYLTKKNNRGYFIQRSSFLFGTIIGLFSGAGMGLLAYSIKYGPASIVVPIFSARNFVALMLLVFFFKEKISKLQWVAVGLLMTGLVAIS